MKFKKVKIQAFRIYDKVENGTFDFNVSENDTENIADFVSIYAPNGFGKTSFYDAVEYGVTESISRFLKNLKLNKDAAKSERGIAITKNGQNILRNRFAAEDRTTEIKIYTTDSTEPIEVSLQNKKRKNGTDFDFDESKVKNKYFQSVILSQEWIDAFLKVDDPYERYTKFVEYFGDSSIDEYYRKLIELIAVNDKKIEEIKKGLLGIQAQLDFNGDKDILKNTNDKIIELRASGELINVIEERFTEKDSLHLSNTISERISDLEFDKKKQLELSAFLNIVFSGSDDKKGVEAYFTSKSTHEKLKKKENLLKENLKKFETLQSFSIEIKKNSEIIKSLIDEKEKAEQIQKGFSGYLIRTKETKKREDEIKETQNTNTKLSNNLSVLRLKEKEEQTKIKSLNKQITTQENSIKKIPQLLSKYRADIDSIEKLQKNIDKDDAELKKTEELIKNLQLEITKLEIALKEFKAGRYPPVFEKEFISFNDIIMDIEKLEKEIHILQEQITTFNYQIKEQQAFNKDIEKFIAKGAEIIDKGQNSTCPLCSHEYKSYKELSKAVAKNSLLSNLLKTLLESRSIIEERMNELTTQLDKRKKTFTASFNKRLLEKQDNMLQLKSSLSSSREKKRELLTEYNTILESIQAYRSILKDLSHKEYTTKSVEDLNKLKDELSKISEALIAYQTEINDIIIQQASLVAKIDILKKEIKVLLGSKEQLTLVEYFKQEFPNEKIELNILVKRIENIDKTINENKTKNKEIEKDIKEIEISLKNSTEELERKELERTLKTLENLQQITIAFEKEVDAGLKINIKTLDKATLIEILNKEVKSVKDKIQKYEKTIKDYNLLTEFKKNVEPYLKYEQAKKTAAELRERKIILEEEVRKALEDEKTKVSKYLDEQINSFFYQDLINDLYRRIDPHPDYKKIKFVCDFKDDKPKLNICLYKDGNSDDLIIPNLYFSTAQLNILSLSIFLAKALNAKNDKGKPIDCIFIDDPIQSMDSINILSTIDLFRSLVVNEKKQIILSTHDENFHNLLKKKMPTKLFKSKFMELEGYGKVKPS